MSIEIEGDLLNVGNGRRVSLADITRLEPYVSRTAMRHSGFADGHGVLAIHLTDGAIWRVPFDTVDAARDASDAISRARQSQGLPTERAGPHRSAA